MSVCAQCGTKSNGGGARYCPRCGTELDFDVDSPTELAPPTPAQSGSRQRVAEEQPHPPTPRKPLDSRRGSRSSHPSSLPGDEDGFPAGAILAGRFRIVGRLGRGGMGDVYRADDLKLGQSVALKFLPESFSDDTDRLRRFLGEVRIARQISHANVCRVYDVIEEDGDHFLAMEYIDGEDMASLLRRIGRLPGDKAVELARQICAGLAAAHDRGVLHRDLKPANVMIDGRGVARIADFGLAGSEEEIAGAEIKAGTPGYMAPEQLRGESVTPRSDIYALGLVLYEMFTGKRALHGRSLDEMLREQTTLPSRTSEDLVSLDPAIDRIIRRCLQSDPARRPASALAVAAALPGGDPVAAALAAGELPSPAMVAALGDQTRTPIALALACLIVTLLAVVGSTLLADRTRVISMADLSKPPAVLAERAREVIAHLGYGEKSRDREWGFSRDTEYLRWLMERDSTSARWDSLSWGPPHAINFWYRESPRLLVANNHVGVVHPADPPSVISGMVTVWLTPQGRLLNWLAVPPEFDEPDTTRHAVDWRSVFELAGFDVDKFYETDASWTPLVFADSRRAWTGRYPTRNVEVRVEAASYRGRPVSFQLIEPWRTPTRMEQRQESRGGRVGQAIATLLIIAILIGSALVAYRNLKLGRGDRRGATRLAAFTFGLFTLQFVLQAHHVPSITAEWNLLIFASGLGLFIGAFIFVLYSALEPYARQLWPEILISWSRALQGRVRDARVGRDLLIGGAAGALLSLLSPAHFLIARALGHAPLMPNRIELDTLRSTTAAFSRGLEGLVNCFWIPMAIVMFLLLLKWIVRSSRWAVIVAFLIVVLVVGLGASSWLTWLGTALTIAVLFYLLLHFGMVSLIGYFWVGGLLGRFPITAHVESWYSTTGLLAILLIVVTVGYSFRLATRSSLAFDLD